MKRYVWDGEKNQWLRRERGVSFEEVIAHLAAGDILDIVEHPNQEKYYGQRIFILRMREYAWLVPFVETEYEIVLKTIIPSRKATRDYLGGKYEQEDVR